MTFSTKLALIARRAGVAEIVTTYLTDFTLEMARQCGVDQAINMATAAADLDQYQADKGHFDVLFECTGAVPALTAGIGVLRPRGVVVQVGMGGDMLLPVQAITAKELHLRGSFRFREEFFTGVELMQKGLIDVKPLIMHTLPMDRAVEGFELASDRHLAMKAQIAF